MVTGYPGLATTVFLPASEAVFEWLVGRICLAGNLTVERSVMWNGSITYLYSSIDS
jgi:hypothetical protein